MVRMAALLLCLFSSGCDKPYDPTAADVATMKIDVDSLKSRVAELEKVQLAGIVYLKTSDKEWQWLHGDFGAIRVGLGDIAKSGNGSKIDLVIQNPLAATLRECSVDIGWYSTDASGAAKSETAHTKNFDIRENLTGGQFVVPSFDLADLPPDRLGGVSVGNLNCTHTL